MASSKPWARGASKIRPSTPAVSPRSPLLASVIPLPPQPCIAYSVFVPSSPATHSNEGHAFIEQARRHVLTLSSSSTLPHSILPSVQVDKTSPALYLFLVTSLDRVEDSLQRLRALRFDNLYASETSTFSPQELYPCSLQCASLRTPCTTCLSPPPFSSTRTPPSCLVPRHPLQLVYGHFLDALRDQLIEDVCGGARKVGGQHVTRLKRGFLIGRPSVAKFAASEWVEGWKYHAFRPLIHCHLEISLSTDRLTIHPILQTTPYVLFPPLLSSFPASGTPITLLPHGVPAFFLAGYTGPMEGLDKQFREALKGLGAGDWEGSGCETVKDDVNMDASEKSRHAERDSRHILAWINVQNKQGEDKGMFLVWPSRLCLGYDARVGREMLQQIPELPVSLQNSALLGGLTQGQTPYSLARPRHAPALISSNPTDIFQRPNICSESIITGERGIEGLALEVGSYVDAVAKEREKERDRIRKEREMASNPPTKTGTGRTTIDAGGSKDQGLVNGSNIAAILPNDNTLDLSFPSETPAAILETEQAVSDQNMPSSALPNPLEASPMSGEKESLPAPEIPAPPSEDGSPASETLPAQAEQISMQGGFSADPFTNVDAWSQSNNNDDIIGMSMGFNTNFGMNLNMGSSGSTGDAYNRTVTMDFDDPFTEDDFDFFDRPSTVKVPDPLPMQTRATGPATATAATFDCEMSSPFFGDSDQISWPGPPAAPAADSSPWGSGAFGERKYFDGHANELGFPAEPPSITPLGTPSAPSAPTTPNVRFSHDFDRDWTNGQRATFDPIPFASSHRTADGKYQTGKFALPSPPDEEDRTEPLFSSPPRVHGWKERYDAATDPRIGMFKKLTVAKRKIGQQGMRDAGMSLQRDREREEWEHDERAFYDGTADESDEDVDDDPLRNNSRPTSPLPAHLPLGPQLLQTRFHHSQLLPLCSPLRPFDTGISPSNMELVAAPINVPTPVSPAAKIGTASEKSKSLETAAYTVAREVVENNLWGRAWPSNSPVCNLNGEIWQEDVRAAQSLISSVGYAEGPVDLATVFDLGSEVLASTDSFQELETPMISVGKGDAVIQVLPSALRFWEKLGLGPRGGRKDVVAFVLFEADCEERIQQAESWLACISATYNAKHLGQHIPGSSGVCVKNGLLPLRFDSFRKKLASLLASIPKCESVLVLYVITPLAIMSLSSPIFRQVCSAIKRMLQGHTDPRMHVHFVPEQSVFGSPDAIMFDQYAAEMFSFSVYDRILRPIDRHMSRQIFEQGPRMRSFFQETAYALTRPVYTQVRFHRQSIVRALDVVDRHTFLHVGYQTSVCGKWILAAVVDERGETHDLGVWLYDSTNGEKGLVELVWGFAVQFGKRANIEWRLVIARLGEFREREVDAWITHLASVVPPCKELPMVHVTLLSAEQRSIWSFLVPPQEASNNESESPSQRQGASAALFVDTSTTTYMVFSGRSRPTTFTSPCFLGYGSPLTYIPDPDSDAGVASVNCGILPLATTTLISVPTEGSYDTISMTHLHVFYHVKAEDAEMDAEKEAETPKEIARSFHALSLLNKMRTGKGDLPWHLGAVAAMSSALGRGEVVE